MNFVRRNFQPGNRGDITKALAQPTALTVVAPESPRPLEMLLGVTYDRESTLTADDGVLHELLMTAAIRDDAAFEKETHAVPMRHILRLLGPEARRDAVKDSLSRLLKNTVSFGAFEQVPLLVSWIERADPDELVHFTLPAPIRSALAVKTDYAYIEIAALPAMRSKFVARLYKALVAELKAAGRQWIKGGDNKVTITASVDQVAAWVCFPTEKDGSVRPGKLKERVLDVAAAQFRDVQAFALEVVPVVARTRGNPIVEVRFELTLNPPSHHQVRAIYDASGIKQFGGIDAPEFRVRQSVWLKAAGHFSATYGPAFHHGVLFGLWTACIKEMLDEKPLSEGYATRRYRGDRLRQEIARRGADEAAWQWAMEEAENPDLALLKKEERKEIANLGEAGRRERAWGGNARPLAVVAPVVAEQAPDPDQVSFEDCSEIWFNVDDTLDMWTIENIVLEEVDRYRDWRGDQQKTIRVRWWIKGNYDDMIFNRWAPSADDIETLKIRLDRFLTNVEFVR